MPLAKITHSFDQDAVALWNANFEEGLKIAKATGAKDVWSARGNMPTIHLMGGTIMGTDVGNSVVNADLLSLPASERHPVPNLSPQRKKERILEALIRQLDGLAREST